MIASENYADLVPKDLARNMQFRAAVMDACSEGVGEWSAKQVRDMLWQACSEDPRFWFNVFCWTLDPRKLSDNADSIGAKVPFITWDYQDEAIRAFEEQLLAGEDFLIEKSRDMGASWLCCIWFLWRWLFRDNQSFLLVSRKETLVEGDDDSLMAHIDFVIDFLPRWMLAPDDFDDTKLYLKNYRNGSVIEGEATVENVGRGGRRTAILMDEFAAMPGGGFKALSATADTTNCRILNSTPMGTNNAFYAQRQKGTRRIRMHWSRHPEKRRGLYRLKGRGAEGDLQFERLDPTFDYDAWLQAGNSFVAEVPRGTEGFRSPWYDRECRRRAHSWEIAQELDIDYQGSNYPFFDPRMLDQLRLDFCRDPYHRGTVVKQSAASSRTGEERFLWHEDAQGPIKLWMRLDAYGRPPSRDYIVGCDVSHGTGASDSVASAVDEFSGEKVAELGGNQWGINQFAELVSLLCGFLGSSAGQKPLLIWEATGPGRTFGKVIVEELKYPRFYRHKDDIKLGASPTQKYGWYSSKEGKRDLLQIYRELLASRLFLNPSAEAIREAGFYVFTGDTIEYQGPETATDPSNQGVNHGDRVIADALCAKLLRERKGGRPTMDVPAKEPPILSPAWRWKNWGNKGADENKVLVDQEW